MWDYRYIEKSELESRKCGTAITVIDERRIKQEKVESSIIKKNK